MPCTERNNLTAHKVSSHRVLNSSFDEVEKRKRKSRAVLARKKAEVEKN